MRQDTPKRRRMMKKKQKKDRIIPVLCGVLVVVLAIMAAALILGGKQETADFIPPPFEPDAVQGTPQVSEALGYIAPYQEGMGFRFALCGNVVMEGKNATVYLTNPTENDVWFKLRVLDENGIPLGETGLLRPGEYVKDVGLNENLPAGTQIKLKIMGYEPETYYSAGSATLNTTIGGAPQ